jgi:septum formation protein
MAASQSVRLTLASSSPARRGLLTHAGLTFDIRPAAVDEPTAGFADPRSFVQAVSWLKASVVAPTIPEGIVLAADTIGWIDGEPILKPADEADARRILRRLGGRDHELWTGVVLWRRPDDAQLIWQERSLVRIVPLDEAGMDQYLALRQWRNNSGAYAVEEGHDPYVRVVEGTVSNVIGLPMESLLPRLQWLSEQVG